MAFIEGCSHVRGGGPTVYQSRMLRGQGSWLDLELRQCLGHYIQYSQD